MMSNGIVTQGSIVQSQKAPNMKYFVMEFDAFKQEVWVDGQNAWISLNEIQKIDFPEAEKYIYDATLFKDAKILEMGYKCTVLGRQQGKILMKAMSPGGFESTYYFDEKTNLLDKIERIEQMPSGPIPITETIKTYIDINGIKLPGIIETVSPIYTFKVENRYTLNIEIDDTVFKPE